MPEISAGRSTKARKVKASRAFSFLRGIPMSFRFALCDKVAICVSDERGVVIGRAEYANAENGYLVRYKAADGQAIESWWGESAPQALGSASRG
ncbi:hypothetical protein [Burkholderia thailandensis]|uniref:hypothetical protein n=1 Tax=Burkholderia thailandensis TaxID=57975 RepID=UPI000ACE722C|nr:hypothetical protein [Burkholderia thailandensis]